jgi:CRP-like cAMP-binding protein
MLVHDVILRKLNLHSDLGKAEIAAICALPCLERALAAGEDVVCQGDRPKVSVAVIEGMLARYHTLPSGRRQYLSFHIPGDIPDSQALFIDVMDHAVCAMDAARVALIPHGALCALLDQHPQAAFAFWRETLVDAAIFRQAITNNSARSTEARLAHFFCEQYYRARAGGHARPGACALPLSQVQLGETLGVSLPSISRALQRLRRTRAVAFDRGWLEVRDWTRLAAIAGFDAAYLHLSKVRRL